MQAFTLSLLALTALATGALAATNDACSGPNTRTVPPPGATVVDITGIYNGSFQTMAEGMAYLPNTTQEHTLFVFPGVYQEQVLVPKLAGPLVLQGYTCNTTSYAGNQVTFTRAMAQKDLAAEVKKSRNDLTSTLRLKSNSGVKMYNINVANTAGKIANLGQALAVVVDGTNYGFYGCNFSSYQDTVYANKGRELFAHTYISGAIDFIFGQRGVAWFESCDVEPIDEGWITASGRPSDTDPSWFVFNRSRVLGSGNGSAYLGRPWRPYARVVWQYSALSNVVNPKGWDNWETTASTDNVFLKEFNNSGAGATTEQRVAFSGQLNASVDIRELFGEGYESEWWVDTKFL
jgi:pectinesterase